MDFKPITCNYCVRVFVSMRALQIHMKFLHKESEEKNHTSPVIIRIKKRKEISGNIQKVDPLSGTKLEIKQEILDPDVQPSNGSKESEAIEHSEFESDQKPQLEIKAEMSEIVIVETKSLKEETKWSNGKYPCNLCGKEFAHRESMVGHRKSVHEGVKFQCNYCTKQFCRRNDLYRHMRRNHLKMKKLQCSQCEKVFASKKKLIYHVMNSCKDKNMPLLPVLIPIRSKILRDSTEMDQDQLNKSRPANQAPMNPLQDCKLEKDSATFEVKEDAGESVIEETKGLRQIFRCNICGKEFKNKRSMLWHRQSFHEGVKFHCEYCTKEFCRKNDLRRHVKGKHLKSDKKELSETNNSNSGVGQLQRIKLQKKQETFDATAELTKMPSKELDIKEELEEICETPSLVIEETKSFRRKFPCNLCDKEFNQKESMLEHRRAIHEGVKHHCEYCTKRFRRKSDVKRHIRTKHLNLKKCKTQCSNCDKEFVSKRGLAYHLRISCKGQNNENIKQKSFECHECKRKFISKQSLWHHKRVVHEGKLYDCPKCDKQFSYSSVLKNHVKAHHDKIKHFCIPCNKTFAYQSGLMYHEKLYH